MRARRERVVGWAFTLPFFLMFIAMVMIPLAYAGWLSLFRARLVGGAVFSGLDNYLRAFQDPQIWTGLTNVSLFLFIAVPVQLAIALFFALLFDTALVRGARFGRLLIFLPFAVPGVIGTMMWGFIYGTQNGLVTQTLTLLGLPAPDLLSSQWILVSIMNITGWEYIGYNMIILFAALKTVPHELVEAAAIDGAGTWRTAWSVKIPGIQGALLLVVIFSIIFSFQLFNEPFLLYPNAPTAIGQDFTPNVYAYNLSFRAQDMNYAAAIAFLLGLVTLIPSAYVIRVFNRDEDRR
jgi:multiple sugar transport system permease protein